MQQIYLYTGSQQFDHTNFCLTLLNQEMCSKFCNHSSKNFRVGDIIGTQVPTTFSLPNYCCQGYLLMKVK